MARPKRSFSPEFRETAVAYVLEQGKSVAVAARELGIGESHTRRLGYPRRGAMDRIATSRSHQPNAKRSVAYERRTVNSRCGSNC
jgi:transposase-like protein